MKLWSCRQSSALGPSSQPRGSLPSYCSFWCLWEVITSLEDAWSADWEENKSWVFSFSGLWHDAHEVINIWPVWYGWELTEDAVCCRCWFRQQSIFRDVLTWACHWAWSISVSFLSWVRTESYHKAPWCLCDLLQQSAWRQIIFVFTLFIFPRKLLSHLRECHGLDCENKNNRNSTVNFVLVLAIRANCAWNSSSSDTYRKMQPAAWAEVQKFPPILKH